MNTIIINASPKGNSKNSNTNIISNEFIRNMKAPCDIRCIVNSDLEELAGHVEQYNTIIFILPLYIHAMPGCQRRLELTEKRRGKMTQNAGYFSAGMSAGGVRMTPDFLRFLSLYVSPRMFITWA